MIINRWVKQFYWPVSLSLATVVAIGCSAVDEKPAPRGAAPAVASAAAPMKSAPASAANTKAVNVEGVISAVGQRTITFQMERKGKVREEVVGVDDGTKIEKRGANVKLRDLEATDKGMISYEPNAYTPALAIKVTGKVEIQKAGGGD